MTFNEEHWRGFVECPSDFSEGWQRQMIDMADAELHTLRSAKEAAEAELARLRELVKEVIEALGTGPLGEWETVGNWMNRAKIIGEKEFNDAFERGRAATKEGR